MDISRYTRKDTVGLYASPTTVRAILNPEYSGEARMTDLHPAWWENPTRHRRFRLARMMPGTSACIDGVEVYRKKTAPRWLVTGEEYRLEAAVTAIGAALDSGQPIKPFYKLVPMQKKILHFWREYETANGCAPLVAEASRGLKMSVQLIGELVTRMGEWGIMYQDGGHYRDRVTHWHVHWDKLKWVEF